MHSPYFCCARGRRARLVFTHAANRNGSLRIFLSKHIVFVHDASLACACVYSKRALGLAKSAGRCVRQCASGPVRWASSKGKEPKPSPGLPQAQLVGGARSLVLPASHNPHKPRTYPKEGPSLGGQALDPSSPKVISCTAPSQSLAKLSSLTAFHFTFHCVSLRFTASHCVL